MALPALGRSHRLAVSLQSGLAHTPLLKAAPVPALRPTVALRAPSRGISTGRVSGTTGVGTSSRHCARAGSDRDKETEGRGEERAADNKFAESRGGDGGGGGGKEGVSGDADASNMLMDDESRALLEDLAAAAARVTSLQADLEAHMQREQEIAALRAELEQYAAKQAAADSLV